MKECLYTNKFKKLNIDASEIFKNYFYSTKILESSSNINRKLINFEKVKINQKTNKILSKIKFLYQKKNSSIKNKIHLSKIKYIHQKIIKNQK